MTHHYYPMTPMHPMQGCEQPQPMQPWHDNRVLWNAAATGAIVGATGAAALSLHRRRDQGIPWQQVLTDTARAGLTAGDVIVSLRGEPLEDPQALPGLLARLSRPLPLCVARDGRTRCMEIELE